MFRGLLWIAVTALVSAATIPGDQDVSPAGLEIMTDKTPAPAAQNNLHHLEQRSWIDPTCTDNNLVQLQQALRNCKGLADGARNAALSGHNVALQKFFHPASNVDALTRQYVAGKFAEVAEICGSESSGTTQIACDTENWSGQCNGGVIAFSEKGTTLLILCNNFFKMPQSTGCGGDSMGNILIHEIMHHIGVRGDVYGCGNVGNLSFDEVFYNADNYKCYANAVAVCGL